MSWHDHAACTGAPTAIFYPGKPAGRPPNEGHPDRWDQARTICTTCPVRDHCLHDAMTDEAGIGLTYRWGMRGGLTPEERAGLNWRVCVECGDRYDIKAGRGQPPIYCSEPCRRAKRDRTIAAQLERGRTQRFAARETATICPVCDREFTTVLGVKQHLRQTHGKVAA